MSAQRLLLCGLWFAAGVRAEYRLPTISSTSLVNAATGQAVFAPYSICSLYGTDLFLNGSAATTGRTEIPNAMGGLMVLIGATPAGIFYISANQINLLIPNSLTPGNYSITVVRDGMASQGVPFVVQEVAPGLFTSAEGYAVALHADGTAVTGNTPASPGEVVVFYGTGLGRTRPDPADRAILSSAAPIIHFADFRVLLDGVALDPSLVLYAGIAPYNGGLYQVNVRMPDDLAATNPEVRLSVAGALSPAGVKLLTSPAQ